MFIKSLIGLCCNFKRVWAFNYFDAGELSRDFESIKVSGKVILNISKRLVAIEVTHIYTLHICKTVHPYMRTFVQTQLYEHSFPLSLNKKISFTSPAHPKNVAVVILSKNANRFRINGITRHLFTHNIRPNVYTRVSRNTQIVCHASLDLLPST